jgi:hypothetical protein
LRNECKDFSNTHGRAGDNHTAQSRFPCFYTKVYLLFSFSPSFGKIFNS